MSSYAYKFCDTARSECPKTETTDLLDKALSGADLTRQEKDRIAAVLYGTFGQHASQYKLLGWLWPVHRCLKRILVAFNYGGGTFHTYYAPDKSSLRKCLHSVHEMIYA